MTALPGPTPPTVRILTAFDDDAAGASEALLALLDGAGPGTPAVPVDDGAEPEEPPTAA
jgi:hypothetical protein